MQLLQSAPDYVTAQVEEFASSRQDSQETRLKSIESNVSTYQEQFSRIHTLECTIDKMEQQARSSNLEICNIPEKRGENLLNILNVIGAAIRITFAPSDIVSIHRVPHANPNSTLPKNIIVRLASVTLRDNVLAAFRTAKGINTTQLALSGPSHKVYLNEHLTLKNKLLLKQTRETASKHGYKYVWVRHASILMRKEDTSPVLAIRIFRCDRDCAGSGRGIGGGVLVAVLREHRAAARAPLPSPPGRPALPSLMVL
ncbi:uncharacterized protein LOC125236112 [Leguminivora glycinivorella]|uniref:uncharacterized protein LOC125236112 n=1 Tax=Leguminivora glycinivorella TaxID=1035111 RepID=UPI00200CB33B|nr:uncharacterized protein LOC125236112 [Leguminivora glycinivorella]